MPRAFGDASKGFIDPVMPDHQILNLIAGIDEFKGRWQQLGSTLSGEILADLWRQAVVESVGSSTRMEGGRSTDAEVERFLYGPDARLPRTRDERAVAGYAETLELVHDSVTSERLDEGFVQRLDSGVLWYEDPAEVLRGQYRQSPGLVKSYDAAGIETGVLFDAALARRVPALTRELVQWTDHALDSVAYHPLLITGSFVVHFLVIHPFQHGNGRLSRLLATWLLLRAGYGYMPYSSLERVLEESRVAYWRILARSGSLLLGDRTGLRDWIVFFLRMLAAQKDALARKLERHDRDTLLPELSERLIDLARRSPRITMNAAMSETGSGRNTIKVHLRRLVAEGRLMRHGGGRGTWYTLA